MTGYDSLNNFSWWLNLLAGVATFLAYLGLGKLVRTVVHIRLKGPLSLSLSVILGFQCHLLLLETLMFSGKASTFALQVFWWGTTITGCATVLRFREEILKVLSLSWKANSRTYCRIVLALCTLSIVSLFICASLISTKADEEKYHMLLPARIVQDRGLEFYNLPWQLSIPVQMQYQLGLSPLHAIGQPHAGNIVSFLLLLVFVYTVGQFVYRCTKSLDTAFTAALVCLAGAHSLVWWVTSGSHIIGDLSSMAAVLLLALPDQGEGEKNSKLWATFAVALFAVTAAGSKISLLPFGLLATALAALSAALPRDWWKSPSYRLSEFSKYLFAALAPWLLFYLPLVLRGVWKTGYPFGPIGFRFFGLSSSGINIPLVDMTDSLLANQGFDLKKILSEAAFVPLAMWAAVFFFFVFGRKENLKAWLIGFAILLFQWGTICLSMPITVRYLSGLLYACFVLAAVFCSRWLIALRAKVRYVLLIIAVIPWVLLQVVYTSQFVPYVIGLRSRQDFCERYIPFCQDYNRLNEVLEADAVVLTPGYISGFYMPRSIIRHGADIPVLLSHRKKTTAPIYLFCEHSRIDLCKTALPEQCSVGAVVYENRKAVNFISRVFGVSNRTAWLQVFSVTCDLNWMRSFSRRDGKTRLKSSLEKDQ